MARAYKILTLLFLSLLLASYVQDQCTMHQQDDCHEVQHEQHHHKHGNDTGNSDPDHCPDCDCHCCHQQRFFTSHFQITVPFTAVLLNTKPYHYSYMGIVPEVLGQPPETLLSLKG